MSQWFNSFYWDDYSPLVYTESQMQKIVERFCGTCALPYCDSKLEMEDGQFLHIKLYEDYNSQEGLGMVICPKCFDNMRGREKSAWIMLNE